MDFIQKVQNSLSGHPASTILDATAGRGSRLWYNIALTLLILFSLILLGLAVAQFVKLGQGEQVSATDAISVSAYVFLILTVLTAALFALAHANRKKVRRRIDFVKNVEEAESDEERDLAIQELWRDSAGDVRAIARLGLGIPLPR